MSDALLEIEDFSGGFRSETDEYTPVLHGVSFTAGIRTPRLTPKQAVLSSVRVLRDYQALGTAPAELLTSVAVRGDTLTWARDRLDGAACLARAPDMVAANA